MIPGIDVSNYQGGIQWPKVAEFGTKFAYVKASEGSGFREITFRSNWDGARAAGLLTGAYHFMRPVSSSLQCAVLQAQLNTVDLTGSLPVTLDIEDASITREQVQDIIARLRDYDDLKRIMLYMDRSMAKQLNLSEWLSELAVGSGLDIPLWLAEYDVNTTVLPVAPWSRWTFWQYGWSRIPGVDVPVDQDWFRGNMEELKALCQS